MLTSKQRAYLRSLSQSLDTIFQIGKGGITDEICKQIANALEARELIKARVLENSGYTAREAAEEIASAIECDVVSCVGTKFVLYKESVKKKRIELLYILKKNFVVCLQRLVKELVKSAFAIFSASKESNSRRIPSDLTVSASRKVLENSSVFTSVTAGAIHSSPTRSFSSIVSMR